MNLKSVIISSFKWIFSREAKWFQRFAPAVLRPDFTWKYRTISKDQIDNKEIPCLAPPNPLLNRRITEYFHRFLEIFSWYYCTWLGLNPYATRSIRELPFGLILKRGNGSNIEEAHAQRMMYAAGIPTPRVISYSDRPDTPHCPGSILMTRLPGQTFDERYLTEEECESIISDLQIILDRIRGFKNPWENRICNVLGGPLRSYRVINEKVGPCESYKDFFNYLVHSDYVCMWSHFETKEEYEKTHEIAKTLLNKEHKIVFTHGDLGLQNILVDKGRITGVIDWETAGWYPAYWEFSTFLRWSMPKEHFRAKMYRRLGGKNFEDEILADRAIIRLTANQV